MSKKTKEEYEREIATIDGIMKCVCRFAQTSSTDGSTAEYVCVYGNSGNFQEQRKEI